MTKRKSALINENVARRWGKLANMPSLTENWLDTLNEDDPAEEEEEAMDDMDKAALGDDPEAEMDYAEGDLERADDAEGGDLAGVLETDEAQELVAGIASHVANVLGIDVDIDMDGEDEEVEDVMDLDDMDPGMHDDPAMGMNPRMRDPAMGMNPRNRDDELDEKRKPAHKNTRSQRDADEGHFGTTDKDKKKGRYGDGSMKHKDGKVANRQDETLDIDVVDDEALTEAVLKRVVERLLSNK